MSNEVLKVELANKLGYLNGRVCAVGNLYGVGRYIDGCRHGWALEPQEDEFKARDMVRRHKKECEDSLRDDEPRNVGCK